MDLLDMSLYIQVIWYAYSILLYCLYLVLLLPFSLCPKLSPCCPVTILSYCLYLALLPPFCPSVITLPYCNFYPPHLYITFSLHGPIIFTNMASHPYLDPPEQL
ncbi:hypothetical protein XENTR_v10010189 [Xenopus tropicalis]|nr:hypothetical protein XENTR_v10010189 [Xenopus tropicalis]